jgi:hypothetical protein
MSADTLVEMLLSFPDCGKCNAGIESDKLTFVLNGQGKQPCDIR